MYADYVSLVMADYKSKRDRKELSINLTVPTPANLRKQCLVVCRERYRHQDARTLKDFFEAGDDQASFLIAIDRFSISKFKPLQKFLNDKTGNTEDKNIELLAWLIDFTDRPFDLRKKYASSADPAVISGETSQQILVHREEVQKEEEPEGEDPISSMPAPLGLVGDTQKVNVPPKPAKKKKPLLLVTVVLAVAGVGTYLFWPEPSAQAQRLLGPEKCMYWTGDHYEQISCNQKVGESVMVIAFDSTRFHHQKMITQPDTITRRSIGFVWYIKSRNQVEFYTAGGMHPVDPQLRLKPITAYIIDKYVLAKQQAN